MKIPFIDLQSQYQAYKGEIDSAIQNVLDTSQYIMGPLVKQFEASLPAGSGFQQRVAGRRNQPGITKDPIRPPWGDGRTAGHVRRRHTPVGVALHGDRHAE